jgi:hypothetical protein
LSFASTDRYRFPLALVAASLCYASATGVAQGGGIALLVNRTTGGVSLANNSDADLPIAGYSLTSAAGAFSPGAWTPVTGHYDAAGDSSLDDDDHWSVLSQGGAYDLSEAELDGGDGGVLGVGVTITLGTPWIRSPYEDVQAELLLTSGEVVAIDVTYLGDPAAPGDLNGDGLVDAADWRDFRAAYRSSLAGLSKVEAHAHGDMNGDGKTNAVDYVLFKDNYETENGAGTFAALSKAVPEPSGFLLATLGVAALGLNRRLRLAVVRIDGRVLACFVGCFAAITASVAQAQVVESFNYSAGALSGRNGGAGWGGSWRNVLSRTGGDWTLSAPGLDYPAMDNEAGRTATSPGDGSRFQRNLGQTYNSGVTYLSFLSQSSTKSGDPYSALELLMGADGDPGRVFQIGLLRNDDGNPSGSTDGGFFARSRGSVGGGGGDYAWLGDFNADTNLFVVRFDLNADTAEMFLNPSDRVDLTGPGDASLDLYNGFAFDRIGIANFAAANQFSIDEIRLGSTAPVLAPAPEIELVVDRESGVVRLQNRSSTDIDIDLYEITSSAASLRKAGWHSLQRQDLDGDGAPQVPAAGDGWEEFDGANASFVGEAFLQGTSMIAGGTRVTLGKLYDTAIDSQDLEFTYHDVAKGLVQVKVVYESLAAPLGDFNGDDRVDAADYAVYRDNVGGDAATAFAPGSRAPGLTGPISAQDYQTWSQNYGATATTSAASHSLAVPEPAGVASVLVAIGCLLTLAPNQRHTASLSN